jgi:hypothetical protein
MTDIVERLRARLQRDRSGRFDPELSIVIGPDIYQDIMEAAGTVDGLRDERDAMRAEIERLRTAAQAVPKAECEYCKKWHDPRLGCPEYYSLSSAQCGEAT